MIKTESFFFDARNFEFEGCCLFSLAVWDFNLRKGFIHSAIRNLQSAIGFFWFSFLIRNPQSAIRNWMGG